MKKKIDDKIKILMENAITMNERSMFIIVGDRGRDQVKFINLKIIKIIIFPSS
jgi:N-acetyltransferase 10